jgi:hypothetical protein
VRWEPAATHDTIPATLANAFHMLRRALTCKVRGHQLWNGGHIHGVPDHLSCDRCELVWSRLGCREGCTEDDE